MRAITIVSLILTGCVFAASANATVYTYKSNSAGIFSNPSVNPNGYGYDSISASYNNSNNQFTWEVDYNAAGAKAGPEGFWLVISDGANPKSNVNEYTMYYGNYGTGNLSAYVYDGKNGPGAWTSNPFIGDYKSNTYGNGTDVFGFSIDTTSMNAMNFGNDWDGTQFANNVGIWFHPIWDLDSKFKKKNGKIKKFNPKSAYWYDTHYDGDCGTNDRGCITAEVPEPTSFALMGLGLLGLSAARKKKLFK